MSTTTIARYTAEHPCPICGGSEDDPRGLGRRCFGYLSSDGKYAHCTREDRAGGIAPGPKSGTYPHRLAGECKCGRSHGPAAGAAKNGHSGGRGGNGDGDGKKGGDAAAPRVPYSRRLEAQYFYLDARGLPVLRVDRLREPKSFVQYRDDGTDSSGRILWKAGIDGVELVPYRLPELIRSAADATVFVPEGEKHVDALLALGLAATCNPMGAGKWRDAYAAHLAGRRVVVLPDNDGPGRAHARQVARSAAAAGAASVKVLDLPGLAEKGDVLDWLAAGGTPDALLELAAAGPEWDHDGEGGETTGEAGPPPIVRDVDAAGQGGEPPANEAFDDPHRLARLFLDENFAHADGRTLAYHRGEFHRWDGAKYVLYRDAPLDLIASIKEEFDRINRDMVRRTIEKCAADGIPAPPPHELPVAPKVTTGLIRNVLQALQSEACIASDDDAPSWIDLPADAAASFPLPSSVLPAANGLVDLDTLRLLPSTPRFFCPFAVPYAFDVRPAAPGRWARFLEELWPDDPASIRELQKWFGYLLSLDKSQEKALLIQGPKRSGKGTLIAVIEALLGHDNVASTTLDDLSGRFGLWPLVGKAVAIIPDARFADAHNAGAGLTERLLSITSRDPVLVDIKMREPIKVRLPTRLVVFTNILPNLREESGALAGRFIPLRLKQSFFGREDPELADRLLAEVPGILRWAIEGRAMLADDGRFFVPESAAAMEESFQHLTSPILAFAEECLEVLEADGRDAADLDTFRAVHMAYQWWCRITGRRAANDNIFSRNLGATYPHVRTDERPRSRDEYDTSRPRRCRGIRLTEEGHSMRRAQEESLERPRSGPPGPRFGPH